ncbi:MAG: T9SS type A sorting domain-containing protein, partial [Bacteroidota bacterium]
VPMRFACFLGSMFFLPFLLGQGYRLTTDIPVTNMDGQALLNPWTGGFNNPQFSTVDINRDGALDMVSYDRLDNTFLVFLNEGRQSQVKYRHAPRYQANFADCNCQDWAVLVDYNCDGLEDVWCGRLNGSNHWIYEQVIYPGDSVGFELRYDPVMTVSGGSPRLMFTVRTDIPAMVDVDYDGDIDVVSTTNLVNYFILYKNLAMERYGRCDTLDFETQVGCWGEFAESQADNTLAVGDTANCPRGSSEEEGGERLHVGSTILVQDFNNDSLVDVLIGDVSFPNMVAAYNFGTLDDAKMLSVETRFPYSDSAVFVELFPAPFYHDINNDGVKDLIVAPNPKNDIVENVNGVAWYENLGQNTNVDFRFRGRTFLGKDHIDNGRQSGALWLDYNGDGLQDFLLAASYASYLTPSGLEIEHQVQLFENVGSLEEPAYDLVDSNFIDLSFFDNPGPTDPSFSEPSMALGDLDGDGDEDLLIGLNFGVIAHFVNVAPVGSPAEFVLSPTEFLEDDQSLVIGGIYNGLKNGVFGGSAAPELYDFDGDNDLDLFIGTRFGRIELYENIGTSTNPTWQKNTDRYGRIKINDQFGNFFAGFAHPRFFDYDQDNVVELLIANEGGQIEVFEDLSNAMTDSLIRDSYFGLDFGSLIQFDAAIIDTTDEYSYLIGNPRGGVSLYAYRSAEDTVIIDPTPIDTPLNESFQVYPNPTDGLFWIEKPADLDRYSIEVFNLVGQKIVEVTSEVDRQSVSLTGQATGIYVVRIIGGGEELVKKIWYK